MHELKHFCRHVLRDPFPPDIVRQMGMNVHFWELPRFLFVLLG